MLGSLLPTFFVSAVLMAKWNSLNETSKLIQYLYFRKIQTWSLVRIIWLNFTSSLCSSVRRPSRYCCLNNYRATEFSLMALVKDTMVEPHMSFIGIVCEEFFTLLVCRVRAWDLLRSVLGEQPSFLWLLVGEFTNRVDSKDANMKHMRECWM